MVSGGRAPRTRPLRTPGQPPSVKQVVDGAARTLLNRLASELGEQCVGVAPGAPPQSRRPRCLPVRRRHHIHAQLPAIGASFTDRPVWANDTRPPKTPNHRSKLLDKPWSIMAQPLRRETTRAPGQIWHDQVFFWSGRRDSNPATPPWQKVMKGPRGPSVRRTGSSPPRQSTQSAAFAPSRRNRLAR